MVLWAKGRLGWERILLKGFSGYGLGRPITMMSLLGEIHEGDGSDGNLATSVA